MNVWVPQYKVGEEVYVFIYSYEHKEMDSKELYPQFILRGEVVGYDLDDYQYRVRGIEVMWQSKNYNPFWLKTERTTTYYHDWVDLFDKKTIERIVKFLRVEPSEIVQFT